MKEQKPPPLDVRIGHWIRAHTQPREGWLVIFVLFLFVWSATTAIRSAEWVPEAMVVRSHAFWAFVLSAMLAKSRFRPMRVWLVVTTVGFTVTLGRLADSLPSLRQLDQYTARVQQNSAIFAERLTKWWTNVQGGIATDETLPFAMLLLFLVWMLVAYLCWATLRQRHPLPAVALLSLAMGFNAYAGAVSFWLILLYATIALLLLSLVRQRNLQARWREQAVRFGFEIGIRQRNILWLFTLILVTMGWLLADVRSESVAEAFVEAEQIVALEAWLDNAFAGVNSRRLASGGGSGSGLPRSYLLGGAPELYQTVMMRTRVEADGVIRPNQHWRAVSYDIYTGRGWARSDEVEREVAAFRPIVTPTLQATSTLSQTVNWVFDRRPVRYTIGAPLQLDHPTSASVSNFEQIVWVSGETAQYAAQSLVSIATDDQLNRVTLADIDPALLAHFTALPEDVPERVIDLAHSLVTPAMTPLQQAKTIEAFVKQYPYSLDADAPPRGRDVVDFFLFDEQIGYCDYYASSMVVMARAVGLPARFASGFAIGEPNADGSQTVYQIDGHSWAEVYFGEYGWIEFEPTAGFGVIETESDPITNDATEADPNLDPRTDQFAPTNVPSVPPAPTPPNWTLRIFLLTVVIALVVWVWWRHTQHILPSLPEQYAALQQAAQRLSVEQTASQTPLEFRQEWVGYGDDVVRPKSSRITRWQKEVAQHAQQITTAYNEFAYSPRKRQSGIRHRATWNRLRRILRLLQFLGSSP